MIFDNFFVWFWDLFQQIIAFGNSLYSILTTVFTLNFGLFSITLQIWQAVLGGGFLVFLTLALVKALIPAA